jgi:peptide/nickel transport system substrate-binding protein
MNLLGWRLKALAGAVLAALRIAAPQGARAQTLVVGQAGDTLTLDPHSFNGIVEASVMSNLFDPLIAFDKNMEVDTKLSLIESWKNPAPDRWVFEIRKGVKFHNGADLTAEDVAYSIERMRNWKAFGAMTGIAFYVNKLASAKATGPNTVEVQTAGPFGPMIRHLRTVFVVNKAHVEKVTKEKGIEEVGRQPVGTGAFKFVEWVPGDHVTWSATPTGGAARSASRRSSSARSPTTPPAPRHSCRARSTSPPSWRRTTSPGSAEPG